MKDTQQKITALNDLGAQFLTILYFQRNFFCLGAIRKLRYTIWENFSPPPLTLLP
jgi:hypothetical protein